MGNPTCVTELIKKRNKKKGPGSGVWSSEDCPRPLCLCAWNRKAIIGAEVDLRDQYPRTDSRYPKVRCVAGTKWACSIYTSASRRVRREISPLGWRQYEVAPFRRTRLAARVNGTGQ